MEKIAIKVSIVSIVGNLVLSLLKIIAGIVAHSSAMISDAIHSASDVFSSIVVIIGVKFASKESDQDHPYGHERFECVAAIILSIVLLISGLFIGHSTLESLTSGAEKHFAIPGVFALLVSVLSIAGKEAMYWYTRHFAFQLDSGALMADAWHHRSDALSSIAAFIGIFGARKGFPMLDSFASLIICLFIVKASYDIFKDAIDKMIDRACDETIEKNIMEIAASQDGVFSVGNIQTRMFGNRIYVEIEIYADGKITLTESSRISCLVHDSVESNLPKIKHISVNMKPFPEDVLE